MPQIINAYNDANSSIAQSLKELGQGMFGDQAGGEVKRQQALKLQAEIGKIGQERGKLSREEKGVSDLADAYGRGDTIGMGRAGIMGGQTPAYVGGFNQYYNSNKYGADDPRTTNAAMGVPGANYGHTVAGTREGEANKKAIADAANDRAVEIETMKEGMKKPTIIGQDWSGAQTHGAFDPRTGTATPFAPTVPQQGFNQPGAAVNGMMPPGPMNIGLNEDLNAPAGAPTDPRTLTGAPLAQWLEKNDPQTLARAYQILDGREAPPRGGMNGKGMQIMKLVAGLEPGFDATKWAQRYKTAQSFSGNGPDAVSVAAANKGILHLGDLAGYADALGNKNSSQTPWYVPEPLTQYYNQKRNDYREGSGATEPGQFKIASAAFADEMARAFKGANLSDAEIDKWHSTISASQTPEQLRANVQAGMKLYNHAVQALDEKRTAGMGTFRPQAPLIGQGEQDIMNRVDKWAQGGKWEAPPEKGQERVPGAQALPVAPAASATAGIPPDAIAILKSRPDTAAMFDKKFGAGSAAKILGQ